MSCLHRLRRLACCRRDLGMLAEAGGVRGVKCRRAITRRGITAVRAAGETLDYALAALCIGGAIVPSEK